MKYTVNPIKAYMDSLFACANLNQMDRVVGVLMGAIWSGLTTPRVLLNVSALTWPALPALWWVNFLPTYIFTIAHIFWYHTQMHAQNFLVSGCFGTSSGSTSFKCSRNIFHFNCSHHHLLHFLFTVGALSHCADPPYLQVSETSRTTMQSCVHVCLFIYTTITHSCILPLHVYPFSRPFMPKTEHVSDSNKTFASLEIDKLIHALSYILTMLSLIGICVYGKSKRSILQSTPSHLLSPEVSFSLLIEQCSSLCFCSASFRVLVVQQQQVSIY